MRKTMLMTVAGLALGMGAAAQAESIRIGVIQPLTGSVAYNGVADVNGSRLAVQQRNARGACWGSRWSWWWRMANASRPNR